MSNEQLVMLIKAGEDVAENMEQLYSQVKGFIRSIAWKYQHTGELEDLEQEGYLALYPAIDGYDPERGVKFLSYAESWIRQRLIRYIKNNSSLRLPVHCLENMRRYERFISDFATICGREPSEMEIGYYLGFTTEQIREIRTNIRKAGLGSLDSPVAGLDGGEDATVGELVASDEDVEGDALDKLQREELRRELWACVDSLPGRQPEVLRMRYQKNMTLGAIGQECNITLDAVRQLQAKALRELRKPKFRKRLRPYLPETDRVYSAALVGSGISRFNQTWTSSTERVALDLLEEKGKVRCPAAGAAFGLALKDICPPVPRC